MSEEQLISVPCQFGENGNFLIERELGRGGMGGVYMGRDKMLDRPVAVKIMLREYGTDAAFVEKFKKEAQAAARLIHPNIAQIYSYGIADGMPYIAMELVAGGSLYQLMKNFGAKIDVARTLKICEQVAQALRCASDQGLVHGDVKPENILLDSNGNAKLVDFGLAAMQNDQSEIWGTPYYIAPEKVRKLPIDYRADMYSLGGTLYHALTGVAPFEGEDAAAVVKARFEGLPKKPSLLRPELTPQIDELVMRMLAENPEERYPTFEALIEAFHQVMTTGIATKTSSLETSSTTTTNKSRKVVLKGRRPMKLKRSGGGIKEEESQTPAFIGDEMTPPTPEEGSAAAEDDDDDEEGGGNLLLKAVGVVVAIIVVVGLVAGGLVWYKISDKKAQEQAVVAQVQKGIATARASIEKTREAAQKFSDEFNTFALSVIETCQKTSDELTSLVKDQYPANVLALIRPPKTKELLDAEASTNVVVAPPPAPVVTTTNGTNVVAAAAPAPTQAPAPTPEATPAPTQAPTPVPEGEIPAFIKDVNDLWIRAYTAQAAIIRIQAGMRAAIEACDKVKTVTGDDEEALRKLEEINNEAKDLYDQTKGGALVEAVQKAKGYVNGRGPKLIEKAKRQIREAKAQADRAAKKKAAEEAEAARKKAAEEAHKAAIEDECSRAKTCFEGFANTYFRTLDWDGATKALDYVEKDPMHPFKTAEGSLQIKTEKKKVAMMQSVQTIMQRNLKDYAFTKGELRGWVCNEATSSYLNLTKDSATRKLTWVKFYSEYPANMSELINKYIRRGRENGKPRLTQRTQTEALLGAALTLRIVCVKEASAATWGAQLAKEAVKRANSTYYFNLAKELFPDIDFSEIEKEIMSEQI